jgi:hypothetical protein
LCLERSERNDKNYEKIPTGIWQRFYFYGGRIPWMKPDKDKTTTKIRLSFAGIAPKLLSQTDQVLYFAALSARTSIMFTRAEQERKSSTDKE